jgi:hypothetical protein
LKWHLAGQPQPEQPRRRFDGGRTWWAHFEFTRINITPTVQKKKIEETPQILDTAMFLAVSDRITNRDRAATGSGSR